MKRSARTALALSVGLTAAGCGTGTVRSPDSGDAPQTPIAGPRQPAPGPSPPVESSRRSNASEDLLRYFVYVRRLPATELAKESETVRHLYAGSRTDMNRVRYAILLSVPATSFNDEVRALEALEPLLKNPEAALHAIAYMVSVQIQEQRRGRELQQKLDALRSLEKSLNERDSGATGRQR